MKVNQSKAVEQLSLTDAQARVLCDIVSRLYPEYTLVSFLTDKLYLRPTNSRAITISWFEFCLRHIPLRLYKSYIDMNGMGYVCSRISDMVMLKHPIDYIHEEYNRIFKQKL